MQLQPPPQIPDLHAECARLKQGVHAPNTIYGYGHDWTMFRRWAESRERPYLPATTETVCLYLTDLLMRGRKVSTASRRTSAIAHHHRAGGHTSPVDTNVRELLTGAKRIRMERPRQVCALSVGDLRKICSHLTKQGTPIAIRNRALLVIGFLSALRRSNLVTLALEDVEFCPEGLILMVRREKQDQVGRGRHIGLPKGKRKETCPVRCLEAWLDIRGVESGPLFSRFDKGHEGEPMKRGDAVSQVVKSAVELLGLDPGEYGGHSLRAGFITAAAEAGVGELTIANHTGHRCLGVLRRYIRRANVFRGNAAAMIGL